MNIPPLRQSTAELLACEEEYKAIMVDGKKLPPNLASERGTEVHWVMWQYITHCVRQRRPSDWAALDRFAAMKGSDARAILRSLRETFVVDYANSVGAELTLRLDADFQPTYAAAPNSDYEGTLDHLRIAGDSAVIEDFKSHPGPFEADTVQSHLYPLLAMQHYAHIEKILFELRFVRYRNCVRGVIYTRQDIPMLMEYMQAYRDRQVDLHQRIARGEEMRALPGAHCQYCPRLAKVTCPIAEFNPQATHTPEERLRFKVWAAQLAAQNTAVLKGVVVATEENVTITDGNGQEYVFGNWPTVELRFPLRETYQELEKWRRQTGEDLSPKLVVGATELKQQIKAFKRKDLADAIANHVDPKGSGKWGVRKPDGEIENGEEE